MSIFRKILSVIILFVSVVSSVQADDWWEKRQFLTYSPRYFGPNAFPYPELMGGKLPSRWEVELRGEYHTMKGDQTEDIFARVYIPIAKGKAAINASWTIAEWYKTSEAVRDERHAVDVKSPIGCHGDILLNFYYQVWSSEKWLDIIASANLKTASGNRLCDARYTDAVSYWFDVNFGRNLWESYNKQFNVRLEGLLGFYCWMTNLEMNRQNDAFLYGTALSAKCRNFTAKLDYVGFKGYLKNGDRPMLLRARLAYEVKKNIISFRYRHGLQDFQYDTFSLGYIRCF